LNGIAFTVAMSVLSLVVGIVWTRLGDYFEQRKQTIAALHVEVAKLPACVEEFKACMDKFNAAAAESGLKTTELQETVATLTTAVGSLAELLEKRLPKSS
jgi:hypothetical protein